MSDFITIIAWIFGVLSTIFTLARIYGYYTYSEMDELRDALKGQKATFPVVIPGSIAIICWAWVIGV